MTMTKPSDAIVYWSSPNMALSIARVRGNAEQALVAFTGAAIDIGERSKRLQEEGANGIVDS